MKEKFERHAAHMRLKSTERRLEELLRRNKFETEEQLSDFRRRFWDEVRADQRRALAGPKSNAAPSPQSSIPRVTNQAGAPSFEAVTEPARELAL